MAVKARAEVTLSSVTDVRAVYRYYLLQSSTLAKPAKPTQNPPGGSWDDTEPGYTSGSTNSLYVVDLTVFSDDTFQYSDVSLSSSYEAAKAAYNKAAAAQNTANSAQNSIDNLQVGGRNLQLGTAAPDVFTPNGNTNNLHYVYALSPYYFANLPKKGDYVTLSFDWEATSTTGIMWPQFNAAANASGSWSVPGVGDRKISFSASNQSGHWSTTGAFGDDATSAPTKIGLRLDGADGEVTITNWKLEFGNKETTWTPAPEDIETELEEVKEAAQKAQSIANGKNTVYYSTTQPTGSLKAGDIWFNTGDGGINFYNGSEWVTHQIGTVSIKDGAVTADQIAVTTALIAKLFAQQIVATNMEIDNSVWGIKSHEDGVRIGLTEMDAQGLAEMALTGGQIQISAYNVIKLLVQTGSIEFSRLVYAVNSGALSSAILTGVDILFRTTSAGIRCDSEYTGTASDSGWLLRGHTVSNKFCCNLGNSTDPTRLYGSSVYLGSTSTAVTSDKRVKKDFTTFDERYENFFSRLQPCLYRYRYNESNRLHTGFVAQEVAEALKMSGIDTQDFAGYVCDGLDEDALTEQGFDINGEEWSDKKQYYLRYEEFIALNTHMIQKLQAKVEELEKRLSESEKE